MDEMDRLMAGTPEGTPPPGAGQEIYSERLWPGPWVYVAAATAAVVFGIAYGAALGPLIGLAVGVLVTAVSVVAILLMAARVVVRTDALVAARTVLPWPAVGRVLALDRAGVQRAKGPRGDPTAFFVMRPGVGPGAVVVEVVDPEDPHATWLIASRRPKRLARAIDHARG